MTAGRYMPVDQINADFAVLDRLAARVYRPAPSCNTCTRYIPDTINPPEGLGNCSHGRGVFYPAARHLCADHKAINA
jgi:hypothetical protein